MKSLRKIFVATLAASSLLLGPASLAEQATPIAPAAAQKTATVATPALWKVSDADTTIYLFGTIHLLPAGIDWYHGKLATAFETSQELVTEIPESSDAASMSAMLRHGTLPEGQTLRAGLSTAERTKYEAALAKLGLPPASFDRYKPWFAAVVLATLPLQKAGYTLDSGVENQLDKRNKALGRPRSGLETLDYQLGIFNGLGPDIQKAYLLEVIEAMPSLTEEIGKMVTAWTKGDAAGLAAMMNAENDDPQIFDALLTNRNRNWAGWIDDRLDRPGVVFIAVGAGHLGGKHSVQDLLEARGIKSVRVQ